MRATRRTPVELFVAGALSVAVALGIGFTGALVLMSPTPLQKEQPNAWAKRDELRAQQSAEAAAQQTTAAQQSSAAQTFSAGVPAQTLTPSQSTTAQTATVPAPAAPSST